MVILLVVVLLFGTKRLKSLGPDLGEAIKGFRRAISKLAGQLEAEKAAREKGYEVWVVLDIRQVST